MTLRKVRGTCPACGFAALALTPSGALVCCGPCDRPTAAAEILAETETGHLVEIFRDDFTLRHPLAERLDDALFACPLGNAIAASDGPPAPPGRYRAVLDAGGLHLNPLPADQTVTTGRTTT